jgi:SAM-dependent methyltransferase
MGGANREAFEAWNGESGERWIVDPDRRDAFAAPVADALLRAADLQPGEVVLDVGCGCGATTLEAARVVGPDGAAHGIDLSELMLEVARRRLEASALTNVTFTMADAQTHPLDADAHDIVISRFGTMFFDEPVTAFANLAAGLRPGGRLCIASWQPLVANDWLMVPGIALLRYATFPDTSSGPGMFAQSEPDQVRATLERAGYRDIDVKELDVTLRLGDDPRDARDHLAGTGIGRAVLDTIDEAHRAEALDAVAAVLRHHVSDDGVRLGGGILITTAKCAV